MISISTSSPVLACGAVSPAGWGCDALMEAVLKGEPLPVDQPATEIGKAGPHGPSRRVPSNLPAWVPKGPRFRRCSPITRFAAAAAQEALDRSGIKPERLGIVMCLMNGCVNFSNRFYNEVLVDVARASPILFPETVFNAPASHIAAHLRADGPVSTLLGDSDPVVAAIEMAEDWLAGDEVTHCLVIAAEEHDWLSANGAQHYHRHLIAAEGAAAILFGKQGSGPRLRNLIQPQVYHTQLERAQSVAGVARRLMAEGTARCLVDDCIGIAALDAAEIQAWSDLPAVQRWSPKRVLGHAQGAVPCFQLVIGVELAKRQRGDVFVSIPGSNRAATGCIISCEAGV